MIAIDGLCKSFGGLAALQNITVRFVPGQVHGVLGENGAGKSSLMNCCYGLIQPDSGTIAIDGKIVRFRSPAEARQAGIGMVHQHFAIVPTLSFADNMALALGTGLGRGQRDQLLAKVRTLADQLGWDINFTGPLGTASVGQQQRCEILKALTTGSRILILDEPTAVLSPAEVDELLPALQQLARQGRTVIIITHKLGEVQRCCDTVAILRRGALVHHGPLGTTSQAELAHHMIGAAAIPLPPATPCQPGEAVCTLTNASMHDDHGRMTVDNVSLTIRRGEITGIAGVDGNGQAPLVEALTGLRQFTSGTYTSPAHIRRAIIPDDRLRHGIVGTLSIRDNIFLRRDQKIHDRGWYGWLPLQRWTDTATAAMLEFDIRAPSAATRLQQLSGGNQQKVVIARELGQPIDIVIAVNPTRGLDIAASRFVFDRLLAARNAGAGILLVHSDVDELMAITDRLAVMHNGRCTMTTWPNLSREQLGQQMLGLAPNAGDQP